LGTPRRRPVKATCRECKQEVKSLFVAAPSRFSQEEVKMTASVNPAEAASGAAPVGPFVWHSTPQISRVLVDFVETVTYRQGVFYRRGQVITGPPGPETPLDANAMQGLLTELNAQRQQLPAGVDARPLQSFIDILSDVLSAINGGHTPPPPVAPTAPSS
jgi:hypothetical protein